MFGIASLSSRFRFRYLRSIEERTAKLEPEVRTALAKKIEESLNCDSSLSAAIAIENDEDSVQDTSYLDDCIQDLNEALETTKKELSRMEETEKFIGLRVRAYRKKLNESAERLEREEEKHRLPYRDEPIASNGIHNENSEDDIDEEGDLPMRTISKEMLQTKRRQQEEHEKKLEQVVETHKMIITNIEILRRRVAELQWKQEECIDKQEECRDFLVASANLDFQDFDRKAAAAAANSARELEMSNLSSV